jgi:hypothetical protein
VEWGQGESLEDFEEVFDSSEKGSRASCSGLPEPLLKWRIKKTIKSPAKVMLKKTVRYKTDIGKGNESICVRH